MLNDQQIARRSLPHAAPKRVRRVGGLDNRTALSKRVRELTAEYVAALGGNPDPLAMAAITAAAELGAITEAARRQALRSRDIDPIALVRLQGAFDRAQRKLGLDRQRQAPPTPTLAQHLATYHKAPEAEVAQASAPEALRAIADEGETEVAP